MDESLYTLEELGIDPPDISHIKVEDGAPVDGFPSEREMRLLVQILHVFPELFGAGRDFLAAANVGLFYALHKPPLVPDVFISLDVKHPGDLHLKQNQTYMVWEYGKVPEVVVEIVSNKKGGELDKKKVDYARLRIPYYVVHDPNLLLSKQEVYVFELRGDQYEERGDHWMPGIGLGVTIWSGEFENMPDDGCAGVILMEPFCPLALRQRNKHSLSHKKQACVLIPNSSVQKMHLSLLKKNGSALHA